MKMINNPKADLDSFVEMDENELEQIDGGMCFFWTRCTGLNQYDPCPTKACLLA